MEQERKKKTPNKQMLVSILTHMTACHETCAFFRSFIPNKFPVIKNNREKGQSFVAKFMKTKLSLINVHIIQWLYNSQCELINDKQEKYSNVHNELRQMHDSLLIAANFSIQWEWRDLLCSAEVTRSAKTLRVAMIKTMAEQMHRLLLKLLFLKIHLSFMSI